MVVKDPVKRAMLCIIEANICCVFTRRLGGPLGTSKSLLFTGWNQSYYEAHTRICRWRELGSRTYLRSCCFRPDWALAGEEVSPEQRWCCRGLANS